MTTDSITIDGAQAAIIFSALTVALLIVRKQLEHSASKYHAAIGLQISSYETEKARLAAAFPEVTK